jgi:hypothetical protein
MDVDPEPPGFPWEMAEALARAVVKRNGNHPPEYVPGATATVVVKAPEQSKQTAVPMSPEGMMARPPQPAVEAGLIGAIREEAQLLEIRQAGIEPKDFVAWGDLFERIISYQQQYEVLPSADLIRAMVPGWQPPEGDFRYWLQQLQHYIKIRQVQTALRENLDFIEKDPVRAGQAIIARLKELQLGETEAGPSYSITLAELLAMERPSNIWLVDGLLVRGGHNFGSGAPGSAKTMTGSGDLALAVASGQDWLGKPTERMPVLVVDEENLLLLHQVRMPLLAAGRGLDVEKLPIYYCCYTGGDYLQDVWIGRLIADVKAHSIGLIIMETLRRVFTGKENDSDDIAALYRQLRRVRDETGVTIFLTHHLPKHQPGSTSRGSGDIEAGADSVLLFRRGPAGFSVTQKKPRWTREGVEVHYTIEGDPVGGPLRIVVKSETVVSPGESEEDSQISQCVEFLYDELDDGLSHSRQGLLARAEQQGYSPRVAERALAPAKEGRITLRSYADVHEDKGGERNALKLWREAAQSVAPPPVPLGVTNGVTAGGIESPPAASNAGSAVLNGVTEGATDPTELSPGGRGRANGVTTAATESSPEVCPPEGVGLAAETSTAWDTDDVPPDGYLD